MRHQYIFKIGFDLDVPEAEAIKQALIAAREHCREQGRVPGEATAQTVRGERLATAEGKYMIRVDGFADDEGAQSTGTPTVAVG